MKLNWKYGLFLIGFLAIVLILENTRPKPIDWTRSFEREDKIPFGNHLLYQSLTQLFPGREVRENGLSFSRSLPELSPERWNLLVITNYFQPSETDLDALEQMVDSGGVALIAAEYFSTEAAERIGCESELDFLLGFGADSNWVNFVAPELRADSGYQFDQRFHNFAFSSWDSTQATVLAVNESGLPNLLRIPRGRGFYLMSATPGVFTNYFLLQPKGLEFVSKCLGYLPDRDLLWDEYNKPMGTGQSESLLSEVMKNPSLRWFWYLLLVGMVLYVIFMGRRRQRAIPLHEPPRNQSLDFVSTVGQLYFRNADHKDLALKKFLYIAEHFRSQYFIDLRQVAPPDWARVAEKSGVSEKSLGEFLDSHKALASAKEVSGPELLRFHRLAERLRRECR